ncbi:phage portal protein [Streptomyces tauricus]|uniref:phage portal protein n=1 Tax=Streptomyces tauricus TaxID=68274 RepID=UPI00342298B6
MAKPLLGALFNRTATATPVPFASRAHSYGRGLFGSSRGTTAQLDSMGSVSTLFAIVNRTAKAEAGVEWGLYRKAKSGKKEDRTPVTSHAALDVWNQPNEFYTQSEFVEAGAQHKQLTGEQWWVIGRVEGVDIPLEMWPVRPDRIQPVPDPEQFLLGYMYTGPDGQQVALGKNDVIFIRTPHPTDPYRGIGPVQALLTDLDAVRYSAEWNRNFFLNSAEPGGLIEVPGSLGDAEFNELRDRWNEQHKGVANAHRVAILEHGKWVDRKFSQRDMQFVELRDVGREIIREAFGFPKPMTGATDDVNRANGDSGERMFARWLVVPDLEAVKDALNYRFLPMFGRTAEGLEFDYVNPVPEDVESEATLLTARSNAAKALSDAQAWDPDDILSAVSLPAMRRASAPPAPGKPAVDSWSAAVANLTAAPPAIRNAGTDPLEQMRQDHEAALDALLSDLGPTDDDWIDQLGEQIEQAIDDDDTAALADLTLDSADAADTIRTALAEAAQQAADRMADEAREQGVTVTAPTVDESLTARLRPGQIVNFGDELAAIATAVATLIASGLAASAAQEAVRRFVPGVSGRSVADAVKGKLRALKGVFKRDQLGGAVHRAQNVGRIATLEAAPEARWVASEKNDGNTCTPCRDIDGRTFTTLADVTAAYGAGPYHACAGGVRCRGTVTAFWDQGGDE